MQKLLLLGLTLVTPALLGGWRENEAKNNIELTQTSNAGGTLALVANGEDFVRQGFITKDGWEINFDHVYVTLAEVRAYQTDPAFNPDTGETIESTQEVVLVEKPQTIDLAVGEADAAPIVVSTVTAPAGKYNALSWQIVENNAKTIVLEGTASKEGETVNFVIGFNQPINYVCGEYVGDERKGILSPGGEAEMEVTLHFDHLFGDGEAPADDAINTGAVGFDPMAALATDGRLEIDMASLKQTLSSEDYEKLEKAIAGLGHVGEGHCR